MCTFLPLSSTNWSLSRRHQSTSRKFLGLPATPRATMAELRFKAYSSLLLIGCVCSARPPRKPRPPPGSACHRARRTPRRGPRNLSRRTSKGTERSSDTSLIARADTRPGVAAVSTPFPPGPGQLARDSRRRALVVLAYEQQYPLEPSIQKVPRQRAHPHRRARRGKVLASEIGARPQIP